MSRLSTIRARAQGYGLRQDYPAFSADVLVLCDIAEAAGAFSDAIAVVESLPGKKAGDAHLRLHAALSRLGSPEGDGPDA